MSFRPQPEYGHGNGGYNYGDSVNLAPRREGTPPPYPDALPHRPPPRGSRWDPRGWSWKIRCGAIVVLVVLVIVIIVAAVVSSQANRYPDYKKLNYQLKDTYSGSSFFDNFDYFTGYDPTAGFVHYVDREGSMAQNLTSTTSSTTAILKVDTTENGATTGRRSVRISSKKQYNSGLFAFDIKHSPYGCGTWPALWLTDQANWPANGEIDVVEAVNKADTGNQVALHTTKGCTMDREKRKMSGSALGTNCYNGTDDNAGCAVRGAKESFGQAFNSNGGGVYVLEYRPEGIRVWVFPSSQLPASLQPASTSVPDPSTFPDPMADFPNTHCDISSHFRNQSIVANIDLCGSWAGSPQAYTTDAQCGASCPDFVANNPSAFTDAYWEFGDFRVWQAV